MVGGAVTISTLFPEKDFQMEEKVISSFKCSSAKTIAHLSCKTAFPGLGKEGVVKLLVCSLWLVVIWNKSRILKLWLQYLSVSHILKGVRYPVILKGLAKKLLYYYLLSLAEAVGYG